MNINNYSIITDVTCDLPQDYLKKNKITTMPLTYTMDEVEYDGTAERSLHPTDFYAKLRSGTMAKTAQVTPDKAKEYFKPELEKGNDILYIGFSSGLSGTFQSVTIAKSDLDEEYPDRKIIVIDSLCASLGQGLLVDYAVNQKAKGKSIDEVAKLVEDIKLRVCHYFTVEDLNHLHRGGRVSKTSAVIGSILGIKPVMHMDNAGKLIPIGKVRGRRQSLDALVEKMGTKLSDYKNDYVFISHGDSQKDAEYVASKVKEKFSIKTQIINYVGPVIGSHSGPGTIALFFIGANRDEKPL
ncbi:DegV family protein [Paludicola sp. MB14-C6]|uniref:DegV family protein n=1 Tax=Paludihabitans sp. MB14-C6 TaxID=3070656 RepID=UPI0027DABDAE|nr:DegV family protein [Paludicola sp. MB14-C6]WMJ21964.1 DegV family protein [Paludicola sp. MB14-C6]